MWDARERSTATRSRANGRVFGQVTFSAPSLDWARSTGARGGAALFESVFARNGRSSSACSRTLVLRRARCMIFVGRSLLSDGY